MIKITVEMCPMGDESKSYHLGTAKIWNDATGDFSKGNYKFWFSRRGQPDSTWKEGNIKGFPRRRLLVWDLLFRCLSSIIGSRNNSVEIIEQEPGCRCNTDTREWIVCPVHEPEEYEKEMAI